MATAAADNGKSIALVPPNATSQLSYSGTPRGPDGISYPDDYVDKLRNPITRMEIFEEMGNDDAVHTGVDARRQEICAANWSLTTEDKSDLGNQILEYAEDTIYPFLDDILRLLGGGAMQYGFGALEPVLQWSATPIVSSISRGRTTRSTRLGDAERIYLRKIAHIRQPGVWSFMIAGPKDPSGAMPGDLLKIRQYVFDGVTFDQRDIPAEKALLWVYNKQGDDHWGVAPTRHCYKAWTFKQQIEKLNLLHIDKFGVGTPVAEEGEGWVQADRDRLATYLKAWRSGAHNYILHPNGGSIQIVGDEGKSTMSALEWVRYYNLAIAKTFLTQQTELGSTETGARALGEVFYSQMAGIVQADCEALANLINNQLIVPLVRYNFGEQDTYPIFAPSQRVRAGTGVASVIQQLINSGAIHVRPEDEAYLRDVFELPAVELKTLEQEAKDRAAIATAAAEAKAGAAPADPNADPKAAPGAPAKIDPEAVAIQGDPANPPPSKIRPRPIAAHRDHGHVIALSAQLADGAPAPAVYGESTWRTPEFSQWENGILRPDVLVRELDMQATRTANEVQAVLRTIDAALTDQVSQLAAKGAEALAAGVKSIACPERLRTQLRKVMLGAAQRARDFGAQSVLNEIDRQTGPGAIGPQRSPGYVAERRQLRELAGQANDTPTDLHLMAEVDRAVEDEIDRREGSARAAARDVLASAIGAGADVLSQLATSATKESLTGLSPYRTEDNVRGAVNVGFGIGRGEAASEIAIDSPAGSPSPLVATAVRAINAAERAATATSSAATQARSIASAAAAGNATPAEVVAATTQAAAAAKSAQTAATQARSAAKAAAAAESSTEATAMASAASVAEAEATATVAAAEDAAAAQAAAAGQTSPVTVVAATTTAANAAASTESAAAAASSGAAAAASASSAKRSSRRGGGRGGSGPKDSDGNTIGIAAKVYSAVMDMGTCDQCARFDGAEFPIDFPEDYTGVQAPNPRCAGGIGRCRCVWVYVTDKEAVPLVPASKGPLPIRSAA
jgi:hypothetical protein